MTRLEAEGFSQEIINALRCVTKTSENENYDDFIDRIKKNPLAVAVKSNDLTDNMDIRRLPYLSDKDVKRLKKHPNAYDPWTEEGGKKMWSEGVSVHEIADHFGRKSSAIITRMKKLGI